MGSDNADEKLIDLLEQARESGDPRHDIARALPGATNDDGYRLQLAYKKRLARRGDPHVGYRISMTSRNGMAEAVALGLVPKAAADAPLTPAFTSLSLSNLGSPGQVVRRDPAHNLYAEAEVAMVMARRLEGPHVTAAAARAAVGGLYAGFDMAQIPLENPFSFPHRLAAACSPIDTQIMLGAKMTEPTIDLRLEGILVSVNGEPRASATAWESLGDPMNTVAFLANKLAQFGEALEPGQVIITGVCPYPQRLQPGDIVACAEFTRLGSVTALVSV
jgi:2-oxo-3-hexenedioate decarboxylase